MDMPTGVVLNPDLTTENTVDDAIAQARRAYAAGVRQIWVAQRVDIDAITSAAQTAQAAAHGHFSLGLGLGAPAVEQSVFGTSWSNTITRLREHPTVLRSIFDDGTVDFQGSEISAQPQWPVTVAGGTPIPVYVAAMGPNALQVTGELADGTLPYLAGPRTVGEYIVPTINKAAADAGRPVPKTIAMVPVLVTDDVDAVRAQLQCYLDAGATDVVLSPLRGVDADRQRLWDVAGSI